MRASWSWAEAGATASQVMLGLEWGWRELTLKIEIALGKTRK